MRLGLCNLNCGAGPDATWKCDTPYTWDWRGEIGPPQNRQELERRHLEDVANDVHRRGALLVVISGGEPMLQRLGIDGLIDHLLVLDAYQFEIETNGTIEPTARMMELARHESEWLRFNVSPKLANSGVDRLKALNPHALVWLASLPSTAFKFVVSSVDDFYEVQTVVELAEADPGQVWVMPAGTTSGEMLEGFDKIADAAIERGWNVTTRLHVLSWGARRGV